MYRVGRPPCRHFAPHARHITHACPPCNSVQDAGRTEAVAASASLASSSSLASFTLGQASIDFAASPDARLTADSARQAQQALVGLQGPSSSSSRNRSTAEADQADQHLYEEIHACTHVQDVLDILEDEAPRGMTGKRAVQALVRLTALAKKAGCAQTVQQEPAFEPLLRLLQARMPSLKATQASAAAASLATLGVKAQPELLASLSQALGRQAQWLSARDLASSLHALVSLSTVPTTTTLDRLGYRAYTLLLAAGARDPAAVPTPPEPATVPPASSAEGPSSADSFTPQGLSMLVHSMARLGYSNSRLLTAASAAAVQGIRGGSFTPQGVSNLLWGTASLNHYFPDLVRAALDHHAQHSRQYKPQETAMVMWALTRLRHHPQESARGLLQALMERSKAAASAPDGPPSSSAPPLQPTDVTSALSMLAHFGILPGTQLAAQLCRSLELLLPRCSTQELCLGLWSLALLKEAGRPLFRSLAEALPARFEAGQMDEGLLRQAFQALLAAKMAEAEAREEDHAAPGAGRRVEGSGQWSEPSQRVIRTHSPSSLALALTLPLSSFSPSQSLSCLASLP
jgi:hypothetical protein